MRDMRLFVVVCVFLGVCVGFCVFILCVSRHTVAYKCDTLANNAMFPEPAAAWVARYGKFDRCVC